MPQTPPPGAPGAPGSMSLLVDMAAAALDPEYEEAAARKKAASEALDRSADGRRGEEAAAKQPGSGARMAGARLPSGRALLLPACLLVLGLVMGVVAEEVRKTADQRGAVRAALVEEIERRTRQTDVLARDAASLRQDVVETRAEVLGADARGRAAARQLAALELATGVTAVRGPGVRVTLDDAPEAAEHPGEDGEEPSRAGDGQIFDRDLQEVTNALWAAGAEHIAVNDQRLTAQSAIRSAGEAVLVDFRPLSPPYVVEAIGDVDAMESGFADGAVARRFQTWTSLYGIRFEISRARALTLPAATAAELVRARPGAPR